MNMDFHFVGFAFSGRHPSADTCACLVLTDASFFPRAPMPVRNVLAQERISRPNKEYQDDTYYDVVPMLKDGGVDPTTLRSKIADGSVGNYQADMYNAA